MISGSDLLEWDDRRRTTFVNALWGPRPLWLAGTKNLKGVFNVAPFTNLVHVGANPPLAGMVFRPHSVPRHTLENLKNTGHLTLNAVSEGMLAQAHHTAARWEGSEFEGTGLTPHIYPDFEAPGVQESPFTLGMKLEEIHQVEANNTLFVVLSLCWADVKDAAIGPDGFFDHPQALGALGLDAYYRHEVVARFAYPKPDTTPERMA